MTLLPIVAREMRVASRRAGFYWTRFTFALLAIVIGSFAWAIATRESPRDTGTALFIIFSAVAYIYSLIAGALWTADCVSEEKREGTLGLLFLTDLRSYDIVFGKLTASSVTAVYGLLAILPVMGVPLLLGGVAPAEFARVVLVCINHLFLSLTIGVLCSSLCQDERKSIGLTILIILLLAAGWPAAVAYAAYEIAPGSWLNSAFRQNPFPWLTVSPGFQCVAAFDEPYKDMLRQGAPWNWFYISVICTHLMGWLSLGLTMFILPRVWQDKAASAKGMQRQEKWRQITTGAKTVRDDFRRRLLEINPFYWLASRDRFKVTLVWLWLGAGAAIWMAGMLKERRDWLDPITYIWTALLLHTSFKCWLAMEASRRLGLDRRSGALELLLSTPLSINDILRGQWLALVRQFGAAVLLVCVVDFVFLAAGLKRMYGDRDLWIWTWLVGVSIFVLDLLALAVQAMWLSLKMRKPSQAGSTAILRVCILPWALFGAFLALVAVIGITTNNSIFLANSGGALLFVWFSISLLNDLVLGPSALRNLRLRFREIAIQRPDARASFWSRMLNRGAAK